LTFRSGIHEATSTKTLSKLLVQHFKSRMGSRRL
jgi:hypothetical protein